MSRRRLTTGSL